MKLGTIYIFFLLISVSIFAQIPDYHWSFAGNGKFRDAPYAIAVDFNGNIYATGEFFSDTLWFPGKFLVRTGSATGNCDFFLTKFSPNGTAIWGVSGGGTLTDRGYGVGFDPNGNPYVTGHYFGSATFGSYTVNSSGNLDVFTAKLDTAGNYLWFKEGKSVSQATTRGLATDLLGNVVIVGYYGSSSVDSVRFDDVKITTNGQRDVFVVKYNSDGVAQWGVTGGGLKSSEQANDVVIDAAGNIYVTGIYLDTATFSGTVLNGNGLGEIFIAKYDPNGSLVWAKSAGGAKTSDDGSGIAVDHFGGVYVVGRFDSAATFGTTEVISNGGTDAFLAKYDNDGNFQWVKNWGGTGADYFNDIAVDAEGYILGTGYFNGTATFGTTNLTAIGSSDIFFIKCNAAGEIIWVKQGGGSDADVASGAAVDRGGNLYGTGYFSVYAKFGADSLVSSGVQDVFVTKIGTNQIPVELTSFNVKNLNGIITLDWTTGSELNNYGFDIERSIDNNTFTKIGFIQGKGTSTETNKYSYSDNDVLANKYYYRLKQLDMDGTFTYSSVVSVDLQLPEKFELLQNYPNPFNPNTSIMFSLPMNAKVHLEVFNILGESVAVLTDKELEAGKHEFSFDASNLNSGVYFYRINAVQSNGENFISTKKMILTK
ncbi:MAG: T9SS type A sorting domain-containing protein [Ignavibacteria bacterium]|nr:T9SS type A sorting domain-containing protein [Ignavibacteria bacterium]